MLVCAFPCANCTRDRGCSAHPVFPAPSISSEGAKLKQASGISCRENTDVYLPVVIGRESGRSSTPRPLGLSAGGAGILDRPVKPDDDSGELFEEASTSLRGAKRRSNPSLGKWRDGLLRSARNDVERACAHASPRQSEGAANAAVSKAEGRRPEPDGPTTAVYPAACVPRSSTASSLRWRRRSRPGWRRLRGSSRCRRAGRGS